MTAGPISRRLALAATAAGLVASSGPAQAQRWLRSLLGGDGLDYPPPQQLAQHGLALAPTPACADGQDAATVSQTAGPFYTPGTPLRTSLLEHGMAGRRLVLVGRVLDTDCRPLPGAVLDFWQADAAGAYDNDGFRLRGHQFADADGVYRLETIKPAAYGGRFFRRTPHIHVKLQGHATKVLTTQVYFPDEVKRNEADSLYRDDLLVALQPGAGGTLMARFDFVLRTTA